MRLPLFCALILVAGSASADLSVRFVEGAPKDRFELVNTGNCPIGQGTLVIDLAPSAGKLVFDTEAGGRGVEVYQPLEVVDGIDLLKKKPVVQDGASRLEISLEAMGPGSRLALTIDVDDTLGAREITVNGSEIAGAQVSLTQQGQTHRTAFYENATALVPIPGCMS